MGPFEENKVIEARKRSSFPYFVLRLVCVGMGFLLGDLSNAKIRVFRPICLSLCISNIYMFMYLENAIARKNIEQCRTYWAIVLLSSLDACAIIVSIMDEIGGQESATLCFEIYLCLCLVEFVRMYLICREFGDVFEWFYFKYGGACIEVKSKSSNNFKRHTASEQSTRQ